jgi:hypothetical protein
MELQALNDLEKFFHANQGGQIHKLRNYFEVYERHFGRYRGTDVHVVEIGVAHGGSLHMWKDYFGPESHIYGVDIQEAARSLAFEGAEIIVGDQGDPEFLETLARQVPRIDILIDDGGHSMWQQENTFRIMFPHVASDGVYLCEDLHTSYWVDFGGGYRRPGTFIELTKTLIDELNAWHSHSPDLTVSHFSRSAHSLHFYESMIVIEKRPIEQPEDLVTGHETIQWTSPPTKGPMNSKDRPVSLARRVAWRIPGARRLVRSLQGGRRTNY